MADGTKIEWADATVNAINGCTVTSPGCTNCYAMRLAGTRMKSHPTREGLTSESKAGPVWNGEVRLHGPALLQPLAWKKPRRIFWNAHGDTFHYAVPDEWIDRVFAVAALTPQHTHMILTKRSKRMREYFAGLHRDGLIWMAMCAIAEIYTELQGVRCPALPLDNVWLGVSVEDQTRADERIPDLLTTPAAVRFLSCEPLLGPLDLHNVKAPRFEDEPQDSLEIDWRFDALEVGDHYWFDCGDGFNDGGDGPYREARVDWVIAGGESGPGARPMHPDWVRSLRDQCATATLHGDEAPVPFHFKHWGEWHPSNMHEDCILKGIMAFRSDYSQEWRPSDALGWSFNKDWQGMCRIGKKQAGRLLDGVEHNGMPQVPHD